MPYLLAVDGGGTKTHCLLFSLEDGHVEEFETGCTSHEFLPDGFEGFHCAIDKTLASICDRMQIQTADIQRSVFGLAGVDTKHQEAVLSEILQSKGLSNVRLVNDAYLGIKAAAASGTGICLINGTGCNTVGINEQGQMFQIGAQFELTGDYGGGHIIGKEAIRITYTNLFRHHRETSLSKKLMEFYKIKSKHDLLDAVVTGLSDCRIPVARLAKLVFDCANQGDEDAIAVLQKMGREYACYIRMLLDHLTFSERTIDLVLAGSLFSRKWSMIHMDELTTTLDRLVPEYKFRQSIIHCPPVVGALRWVLEDQGVPDAIDILERVSSCCFREG